jgi:cell division protease FtsH
MLQKIILYNLFTFGISYSMSNINSINKYKPIMSIQEFEPSKIINNLAKSSANLDIWNINEFIYNINHISGITLIKENNQINGIVSIDDNIVDNLISLNNLHYTETGISQFSDKVIDLIVKNDILYDIIQTPDMPVNQIQNLLSIGMNIVVIYFIFSILSSLLQRFKSGGMIIPFKDNKLINADEISTRFDDVAGCDEVKYELQEIVDFLKNPDKYYQAGAKVPKGVLLEGPPGTGKTLLARAVAGEAGVSFISVSGSEFVQMFVGVGAARVRELFENAKKHSPCVIFIDEIDAIGRKRGDLSIGGNNEEREQTLNQLLTNMDGFTQSDSITVIAATNRIDILDKALTRSGRFDRKVRVGFPNLNGRKKILQVHLKNKQVDPETDFEEISLLTSGFSGADIENMANEAVIIALRDNVTIINTNYLVKAYEKLTIGLPYNDNEVNREKDKLVAYHESGHAIIAELFKEFFNVRKVTINANTNGVGGYTLITVKEQYIQYPTKKFLLANIISNK